MKFGWDFWRAVEICMQIGELVISYATCYTKVRIWFSSPAAQTLTQIFITSGLNYWNISSWSIFLDLLDLRTFRTLLNVTGNIQFTPSTLSANSFWLLPSKSIMGGLLLYIHFPTAHVLKFLLWTKIYQRSLNIQTWLSRPEVRIPNMHTPLRKEPCPHLSLKRLVLILGSGPQFFTHFSPS